MASKYEPDSFERDIDHVFDHDIAVMIRSGYSQGKWPKDRFEWPKETILIVQSPEGTPKMYYNKPEQHAELLFQADLKADLEADLESDLDSANKSPESANKSPESANKSPEYTCTLYINYSPCGDCADKIIQFIEKHDKVEFNIHFAMTYTDGFGRTKLKGKDRITVSPMDSSAWKKVTLLMLDYYIGKMQKSKPGEEADESLDIEGSDIKQLESLKENIKSIESGYEVLKKTVEDLGIKIKPDDWKNLREKADENEKRT